MKTFQDTLKEHLKDPEFAWEYVQDQNRYISKLMAVVLASYKYKNMTYARGEQLPDYLITPLYAVIHGEDE